MELFETIPDLAERIGIPLRPPSEDDPAGGAEAESDWGWRLRGPGRSGGAAGGWLLTFAREDRRAPSGHLIAYEIDENDVKTGRCALLRSPWDADTDEREHRRVMSSDLWGSGHLLDEQGEADLSSVDAFLQR